MKNQVHKKSQRVGPLTFLSNGRSGPPLQERLRYSTASEFGGKLNSRGVESPHHGNGSGPSPKYVSHTRLFIFAKLMPIKRKKIKKRINTNKTSALQKDFNKKELPRNQ
jgi:hypothetical protein